LIAPARRRLQSRPALRFDQLDSISAPFGVILGLLFCDRLIEIGRTNIVAATGSTFAKPVSSAGRLPEVTPVTGVIGASVTGLDVRGEHSPEVQDLMNRALHEHGVLFVRFEGEIEPEDQRRFARMFGELHESYFNAGEIPFVSQVDSNRLRHFGPDLWHTDSPMIAEPPQAAVLRAVLLPDVGGDTMWASTCAAYEALSSKMQRFLEGLEALHTSESLLNQRPAGREGKLFKEYQSAVHPVVIRDSVTGKPALYVNRSYTERLVGLSDHESASVLGMLLDHLNNPDFQVRLKWDTQTIAIWEERVTLHRAVNDYEGRRIMHRTVIDGRAPEAYGEIDRARRDQDGAAG
jgi:taurine dioxygenase